MPSPGQVWIRFRRGAAWVHRRATAGARVLPDFLIIGAQKGGTTSLYEQLCASPAVLRARDKELHYFDWYYNYGRGPGWYRACFPTRRALAAANGGRGGVTGEASPYYLFHPLAPERIAAALPQVRVIVMLRNPVERAISQYNHAVRAGFEKRSLEAAFRDEVRDTKALTERIIQDPTFDHQNHEMCSYLSQGIYAPQLRRWMERVPRERMLIIQSESYFADPVGIARQVFEFLGVSAPAEIPEEPLNVGGYDNTVPLATISRLEGFFDPHNAELFELIGRRFAWGLLAEPDDAAPVVSFRTDSAPRTSRLPQSS